MPPKSLPLESQWLLNGASSSSPQVFQMNDFDHDWAEVEQARLQLHEQEVRTRVDALIEAGAQWDASINLWCSVDEDGSPRFFEQDGEPV